jgi:serine/threonine-protein kinase
VRNSWPPAVIGPVPPDPMIASGAQMSLGLARADASNDVGTAAFAPQRRSKASVVFGVLVAAAVGGGIGLLAFQWTAPPPRPPVAATAATSAAAPAPSESAKVVASASPAPTAALSSSAAPGPKQATVKVTTEPPGAIVREDGKELCAPTPCDVVFKGEAADPARVHKLVITRPGFRAETRTVKATESPVHLKLAHVSAAPVRPPPAPTKPDSPTPNGFKDTPY